MTAIQDPSISIYLIAGIFFIIAFAYSSVGLGGGSSYTALMAIFGFNYLVIPTLSLALNMIVTTISSFNFIRHKHARLRLITPFLLPSIPMSYLGGSLKLPKEIFLWILLLTLVSVAVRIYLFKDTTIKSVFSQNQTRLISVLAGAILGLVSGIVGIGGGVYLVPLIIILGLGSEKEAAATGALFIWINSLSGLAARLQYNPIQLENYIPILFAVIIGGGIGSYFGSKNLPANVMQKILGGVILLAIIFLAKKLFTT